MPRTLLFAQSLAIPRSNTARIAICKRPVPVLRPLCMRASPDESAPLNARDQDPLEKEDVGEGPLVGGKPIVDESLGKEDDVSILNHVVKPADYEDFHQDFIVKEVVKEPVADAIREVVVDPVADAIREVVAEQVDVVSGEPAEEVVEEIGGKEKSVEASAKGMEVNVKEEEGAATTVGLKMTPEQIEKGKAAKAAALKAEEEKAEKKKKQTKDLLENVEKLFVNLGTKSGVFTLGETARSKAELVVQQTIELGEKKEPLKQERLKVSAALAAKSVVETVVKGWEGKVVPLVKEQLPEELSGITNKALASLALGFFVAISLLPSLFSGGKPQEIVGKKKIDTDTAGLEKKLAGRDRQGSSYASKTSSEKSVFPPEDDDIVARSKRAEQGKATSPPVKQSEVGKGQIVSAVPKLPVVSTPSVPAIPVTPPVADMVPKPELSRQETTKQPVKPREVTPPMVLSSVTRATGSSGMFLSSSFDSLSAEPTVVLQVSKAFHKQPAFEQRIIAGKALTACRELGYERVSFVEVDSGIEVAHAGVDIDLEDESENLRAELQSLRKRADKIISQNMEDEAQVDALQYRLQEERDEFSTEKNSLQTKLANLRNENAGLVEDLAEAKDEISKMPDRIALEERTIEAEKKSNKMMDTVEMLSKQLTGARNEEANAKQVAVESLASVKEMERSKAEALASVAGQIERAQNEANTKATVEILAAQNESKSAVNIANKRVHEMEESMASVERESTKTLEQTKSSYEKQLAEAQEGRQKEVISIQDKYEAKLNELQRKASADLDAFQKDADKKLTQTMKEAKEAANSLTKERDQAIKETQKVQTQAEKAAAKAVREKEGLQARISKLEGKMKGGDKNEDKAAGENAPQPEGAAK